MTDLDVYDAWLGRTARFPILRFGPPGAFLAVNSTDTQPGAPVLLLPGAEVPQDAKEGDAVQVFVYLDSEDRPIATTRSPAITLGKVAFLTVTDQTSFGSFVDWGLAKELLVPLGEQTREIHIGERHPIGLLVDDTGRLAGTMRVAELLRKKPERALQLDEWVVGEAWRNEPEIGLFVILERSFVGLVPATEPHALSRGESAKFRVTSILMDGKIELSLRAAAYEEIEGDAKKILATLVPSATPLSDHASPEEIRARFGLSRKAFKRAVGRLLKQRVIDIDRDGVITAKRV